jgi:hypothetical protein
MNLILWDVIGIWWNLPGPRRSQGERNADEIYWTVPVVKRFLERSSKNSPSCFSCWPDSVAFRDGSLSNVIGFPLDTVEQAARPPRPAPPGLKPTR